MALYKKKCRRPLRKVIQFIHPTTQLIAIVFFSVFLPLRVSIYILIAFLFFHINRTQFNTARSSRLLTPYIHLFYPVDLLTSLIP
jgi:hypothetical protein